MRSLSIQVQPERSPDIDIEQVRLMCEEIAKDGLLVKHHQFDHGVDNGPYFNFTFGTDSANKLWGRIRQSLYENHELGAHMRKSSMAMCSSEDGWNDYLLLYHFDPEVKLDSEHNLYTCAQAGLAYSGLSPTASQPLGSTSSSITMLESIAPVLNAISTAAKAMVWFTDLRKKTKGEVRALVEEIKENSKLCFRVVEDRVPPEEVIPRLSTAVFDRLNESGFDFNAVKRKDIPAFEGMNNTDLASWAGKSTQDLIQNIYDKIKDLRSLHALAVEGNRRFRPRIINIHKRILLLLQHARHTPDKHALRKLAELQNKGCPEPTFNFQVDWSGEKAAFEEVTGLTGETDAIEYRDSADPELKPVKPGHKKSGDDPV